MSPVYSGLSLRYARQAYPEAAATGSQSPAQSMTSRTQYPDFPILFIRTTRHMAGYTVGQPLGILYLGSALREQGFRNIRAIDMRPDQLSVASVMRQIRDIRPRFVGLSCLSCEAPTVQQLIAGIRDFDPTIHIALGGPLPSSMHEGTLEALAADSACTGEGDQTIRELVEAVAAADSRRETPNLEGIAGVCHRRDDRPLANETRPFIEDLDVLPMPAWDLLDMSRYFRFFGITGQNFFLKHKRHMSVMTSRGCPFRCAYCHNVLGKRFRPRSPEHVMREIHALAKDYGVREFHLIDDTFNLDLDRAKTILDEMAKMRPRVAIAFPNGIRADHIDEEFLVKARQAGCYKISYAVETATPRLQKAIHRNLNIEKVREAIEIGDRLGIMGHGLFMIGFPDETEAEMRATVDFALRSRLHTTNFFIVNPFEGTEIYSMFKKLHPEMQPMAEDFDYFQANMNIYTIPNSQVQKIVQDAHRRFFLNPWRLYRLARLMPNKPIYALKGAIRLGSRAFLGKG